MRRKTSFSVKIFKKKPASLPSTLQSVAEVLSEATHCAVFLSAPRFDHDFVLDIKLVGVDANRCLCVIITDFGQVMTELLYTDKKMSSFTLKRLENFFRWRLTGLDKPTLSPDEEILATRFYNEVMMRHLVGSTHFTTEDIYKTRLFTNYWLMPTLMMQQRLPMAWGFLKTKRLFAHCCVNVAKAEDLSCWIGGNLHACSALAIPYKIIKALPDRSPF